MGRALNAQFDVDAVHAQSPAIVDGVEPVAPNLARNGADLWLAAMLTGCTPGARPKSVIRLVMAEPMPMPMPMPCELGSSKIRFRFFFAGVRPCLRQLVVADPLRHLARVTCPRSVNAGFPWRVKPMVMGVNEPCNMVARPCTCYAPESGPDEVRLRASLQSPTRLKKDPCPCGPGRRDGLPDLVHGLPAHGQLLTLNACRLTTI